MTERDGARESCDNAQSQVARLPRLVADGYIAIR